MDEFAAVGEAIGNFASDDALVVVGTTTDESIQDELRVTVVATGLGSTLAEQAKPEKLRVVPESTGEVDYRKLDTPTVVRNQVPREPVNAVEALATDPSYLDIPAFLRRQAD
jgi:cell division protein FtsZ